MTVSDDKSKLFRYGINYKITTVKKFRSEGHKLRSVPEAKCLRNWIWLLLFYFMKDPVEGLDATGGQSDEVATGFLDFSGQHVDLGQML